MKFFIHYVALSVFILLLQGCLAEKPVAVVKTDTQVQETTQAQPPVKEQKQAKLTQHYTLQVNAPKNARVRVLNIKPRYHDNMMLEMGKYHIEVTKKGYQKYKKWILLENNLVLNVKLQLNKNPYDTSYFKYVTKIEWKNHNEIFSLQYDSKSKLIWAMQSAYVDYVIQKKPRTILKDAVFAKGVPWPKVYETKINTLIYNGHFRYRGRNFLFKNKNEVTLYRAGVKNQTGKKAAHLSKLQTNSMINYWRLPKEKELLTSNPFKKYQKYFQIKYSRYKHVRFNLPILCTKLKKNSFYSNCSVAYAYNKRTGLYDGRRINQAKYADAKDGLYFALNHAKNFALVTPVRAVATEYDRIIFNTKITSEQKLAALTTLLIKEKLQKKRVHVKTIANAMASQAMHMIFGDPKVYGRELYASSNEFSKNIRASKKRKKVSTALFSVKNGNLHLKSLR